MHAGIVFDIKRAREKQSDIVTIDVQHPAYRLHYQFCSHIAGCSFYQCDDILLGAQPPGGSQFEREHRSQARANALWLIHERGQGFRSAYAELMRYLQNDIAPQFNPFDATCLGDIKDLDVSSRKIEMWTAINPDLTHPIGDGERRYIDEMHRYAGILSIKDAITNVRQDRRIHPGRRRVIEVYCQALGISLNDLANWLEQPSFFPGKD